MNLKRKKKENVWLNIATGTIGGMLGAFTMNQFQAVMQKVAPDPPSMDDPATVKAAQKITRATADHYLTPNEKKTAEPVVHYGFGALVGAIYGIAATAMPVSKAGKGSLYGATVWLLADEVGVPAAGLSKPPNQIPAKVHFEALAAHVVYGLTLEGVRWLGSKTKFA